VKRAIFVLGSMNAGVHRFDSGFEQPVEAGAFRNFEESLLDAAKNGDWETMPDELNDLGLEWITRTFCLADIAVLAESSLFETLPYWSRCFAAAGYAQLTAVICFHDPFLEYMALRSQVNRGCLFRRSLSYDAYLARYAVRVRRVLSQPFDGRLCPVLYADWQNDPSCEISRVMSVCRLEDYFESVLEELMSCQFLTFPGDVKVRGQAYLEETRNVIWTVARLASELAFDPTGGTMQRVCKDNLDYLAGFQQVFEMGENAGDHGFLKLTDVTDQQGYFRRMSR